MTDRSYLSWLQHLRDRLSFQRGAPAVAPSEPRRLGLALGGGGGKGAAHIGVLQVLEELDIPIDYIAGTSAGGAVAICYSAGLSFETIRELFRRLTLRKIAIPDPQGLALIGQRRRKAILEEYLGDRTFADLRIPCVVTATDLATGQLVEIDEGSLVEAVLATTAIPFIVPPVIRGEMILADGGLLNNVPVSVVRARGAQRVIGVQLSDASTPFSLEATEGEHPLMRLMLAPQQFAIAQRALSIMLSNATALQLRANPPDLLIKPSVADIRTLDLSNPEKGWQAGLEATRAVTEALLELRAWRLGMSEAAPEAADEAGRSWFSLPFQLPRWGEESRAEAPVSRPAPSGGRPWRSFSLPRPLARFAPGDRPASAGE